MLVSGEGWCRESATKTRGDTGEGRRLSTLPWAFQHLATILSEILPSGSISDASQQTMGQQL